MIGAPAARWRRFRQAAHPIHTMYRVHATPTAAAKGWMTGRDLSSMAWVPGSERYANSLHLALRWKMVCAAPPTNENGRQNSQQKTRWARAEKGVKALYQAGGPGLEPGLTNPESVVLPIELSPNTPASVSQPKSAVKSSRSRHTSRHHNDHNQFPLPHSSLSIARPDYPCVNLCSYHNFRNL